MVEEARGTDEALMRLWTSVCVEVVIDHEELVLYDPERGYVQTQRAFTLARAVPGSSLYVITAWNPYATERDSWSNRVAMASMLLELSREGLSFFPSRGWGADWEEPGTAFFALSDDTADRLARRYGQLGYYRFGVADGVCVDATGRFPPAHLGA